MNPCPCWLFCFSHTCWKKCPVFRIRLKQSLQQNNCQAKIWKNRECHHMTSTQIVNYGQMTNRLPATSASRLIPPNYNTADGRNFAPVEVGRLFHYLQGFTDPRWFSSPEFLNRQQFFCQLPWYAMPTIHWILRFSVVMLVSGGVPC